MAYARLGGTGDLAATLGVVAAGHIGHRPVHCAGHPDGGVGRPPFWHGHSRKLAARIWRQPRFLRAAGGFATRSNSGANAVFATTQVEIARTLGVDVLWFMAVHNVAVAFLLMASPGKIEMAIQLSPAEAANHRRWIFGTQPVTIRSTSR